MSTLYNKMKKMVGMEEQKWEQTKYANCIVTAKEDDDGELLDELIMNEAGLESLTKHYKHIVSFIGPPGVGKSTLCSAVYNTMRGDKCNYFEASQDEIESFTRGIWSLNEHTKVGKADKDVINALDLEGIDNRDAIHYLVVVAMTLSKAILLCCRGARPPLSLLKTLESGVRIFNEKGIRVPRPVIYIQKPFGMTTFKIKDGRERVQVDGDGLIRILKKKNKLLEPFEMRLFELPEFENNRFDAPYMQSVRKLINDLKDIEEHNSAKVKTRVQYAKAVIAALNQNSPRMISDMNFNLLQNEVKLRLSNGKSSARVSLRSDAESKLPLTEQKSFADFCKLVCVSGQYGYGNKVKQEAETLAFYDASSDRHNKMLEELDDEKHFIDVEQHIGDIYEKGIADLKSKLRSKGSELMKLDEEAFSAFVKYEIAKEINKIDFLGSTSLPHELRQRVADKRHQLNTELVKNTQNVIQVPKDHLSDDILTKGWKTAVTTLESQWEERKQKAIVNREKVTTAGDHKCPNKKCGNNHSPGVGHKKCGRGALWLWLDSKTKYCICDSCQEVTRITSVCCSRCSTSLNASVVPK